jgi:hypothetical protein
MGFFFAILFLPFFIFVDRSKLVQGLWKLPMQNEEEGLKLFNSFTRRKVRCSGNENIGGDLEEPRIFSSGTLSSTEWKTGLVVYLWSHGVRCFSYGACEVRSTDIYLVDLEKPTLEGKGSHGSLAEIGWHVKL